MGLINRFCVSNMLSVDSGYNTWSPQLRHVVLNCRGQSTAINIANGGGKTTMVDAMIGLLSRDRVLMRETYQRFAPKTRGNGIYSHVQIEIIRPSGTTRQKDLLTESGMDINGETWVFGVYGYKDNGSQRQYYFYKGRLEDLSVAEHNEATQTLSLISNKEFEEKKTTIKGFRCPVTKEQWIEALKKYAKMDIAQIKQQAQWQKADGEDQSSMLMKLKVKPGEKYEEVFFNQIIAPNVLKTLIEHGEDGDITMSLEESLTESFGKLCRNRVKLKNQHADIDELNNNLSDFKQTIGVVEEIEKIKSQVGELSQKLSTDFSIMRHLREKLVGIPNNNFPDGIVGEIAKHLVYGKGDNNIRILDTGLAFLLKRQSSHLNQYSQRKEINLINLNYVIENNCDFKTESDISGRREGKAYLIDDAKQVINLSATTHADLNKGEILEHLAQAVKWYQTHGNTNTYRQNWIAIDEELKKIEESQNNNAETQKALGSERLEILERQKALKVDEGNYLTLKNSPLFSEYELENLHETAEKISQEFEQTQAEQTEHAQLKGKLENGKPAWDEYHEKYKDTTPDATLQRLLKEQADYNKQIEALSKENEKRIIHKKKLEKTLGGNEEEVGRRASLADKFKENRESFIQFDSTFKGVSPEHIKTQKREGFNQIQSRFSTNRNEQNKCREGIKAVEEYIALHPQYPLAKDWLLWAKKRYEELFTARKEKRAHQNDLKRQRQALNHDVVVASQDIDRALITLKANQQTPELLHEFISHLELAESRKLQVLSVFSSILFSPVFKTQMEAHKAACLLESKGQLIPIFIKDELLEFCKNQIITVDEASTFFSSTIGGISTRAVSCIMNPTLVAEEKARLETEISSLDGEIADMEQTLNTVAPESESYLLANRAKASQDCNHKELIKSLETAEKELQKELDEVAAFLTNEWDKIFLEADKYLQLGGKEKDEKNSEQFSKISNLIEKQKAEIAILSEKIDSEEKEIDELTEKERNCLPYETKLRLNTAIDFLNNGGPQFFHNLENTENELNENLKRANGRNRLTGLFDSALRWLESRQEPDKSETRIDEIKTQIAELIIEGERLESEHEILSANLVISKDLCTELDQLIFDFIKKYRRTLLVDDVELINVAGNPLFDNIHTIGGIEHIDHHKKIIIVETIQKIRNWLEESNFKNTIDNLKYKKKDIRDKEENLAEAIKGFIQRASKFSSSEKEQISTYTHQRDFQALVGLHKTLQKYSEEKGDEIAILSDDVELQRKASIEGLTVLLSNVRRDFQTFKAVAKRNTSKIESHFIVEADIVSDDMITTLLESILYEIETYESTIGLIEKDEEKHQRSIVKIVADKLNGSIFKNPKVKFINRKVRPSGKIETISGNLSTGQKAALSMMWLIKFSEFATERQFYFDRSLINKSETVVIIDGLFSTLSDSELIDSAMAGIEATRGNFQLIGLIHSPHYHNDENKFPVYILGKVEKSKNASPWVNVAHINCVVNK